MKMNAVDYIAWTLVVVGGLNWGLVGAFDFNLVDELFGVDSALSTIVYVLVGLSALYMVVAMFTKRGANTSAPAV